MSIYSLCISNGKETLFIRFIFYSFPNLLDDESDIEMGSMSLSSSNSKRARYTNGGVDCNLDEYGVLQGKCSVCGSSGSPTYTCYKCRKLFHEQCDNFRVDKDNAGICGKCLTSVIIFIFNAISIDYIGMSLLSSTWF